MALHGDKVTYFDSFGEWITKENNLCKGNKNIVGNMYRIQAYSSIMCRYFCIGLLDFMLP